MIIGGYRICAIDPCLVNARDIEVPSDSSEGGIKLLRIVRIRKTPPEGDAVFCR
jgi:hypothetical protein